ncbi:MAG TPA: hypothetical protein PLY89_07865, partial [Synergistaceae bacterium]|nr:hypothetical protein [Synergistaceae bacterium]
LFQDSGTANQGYGAACFLIGRRLFLYPLEGRRSTIRLMLGDCLEVMADIPDGSVDLVLCDLPYGTTACKWDSVIPFEPLWEQYRRIAKPNAAVVLTASQPFTTALIASNMREFRINEGGMSR